MVVESNGFVQPAIHAALVAEEDDAEELAIVDVDILELVAVVPDEEAITADGLLVFCGDTGESDSLRSTKYLQRQEWRQRPR